MVPALSSTPTVEARWCWISLTSQFLRRTGLVIHTHRARTGRRWPLDATRAWGEGPGPVPGHQRSRRAPPRKSTVLGRGPVPGVATSLSGGLALVIAQVLAQLSAQAPLQSLLDQGRQQAIGPGHLHLTGINLLKQAVQSPLRTQPVNRITPSRSLPSRSLLCAVISSSHQCQSFQRKGLTQTIEHARARRPGRSGPGRSARGRCAWPHHRGRPSAGAR